MITKNISNLPVRLNVGMMSSKQHIISQLKKDLLLLQGFKNAPGVNQQETGLGPILNSFPNKVFPIGAIHEFIAINDEEKAATTGFISALISSLMRSNGVSAWISKSNEVYPPSLSYFNLEASNIIFVQVKNEKDILWTTEEALRCEALSSVITYTPHLSFTASRRLQLAVEKSLVTGFIIRPAKQHNTTTCLSRWKITPLASELPGEMPGVGFPKWNVELLKVRNGHPGQWSVQWVDGKFLHTSTQAFVLPQKFQKAG